MKAKRPQSRSELHKRLEAIREGMRQHASTLPPEEKDERLRRARADDFYFFRTYLPHYFINDEAPFHHDLHREANKPGINALAAPRGSAKSTLETTAETLRRAVFNITPFQIVVKENREAAIEEVAAIQFELEENPRIKADFGSLKKYGDWEDGDFITTKGCRVLALGIGQQIRGKKHRQHRPGRIVIDDPEKDKHVKNPRLVKEFVEWVLGAAFPSLDPDGGILTWLGTMMSKRGGLALLMKNELINSRIWRAIENGQSYWESRFPLSKLREIRELVKSSIWRKEYMNDPGDDPDATFQEWMLNRFKREELKGLDISGVYTATDPSLKHKKEHDMKATIVIKVAKEFRGIKGPAYLITRVWLRRASLDRMFDEMFNINKQEHPSRMGLEIQTWQELLLREIQRLEQERQVRLPIFGIKHHVSKEARIERLQPLFERKLLWIVDDPDDEDVEELVEQFLGFDDPAINDDGPDAVEMGITAAERFGRKIGTVKTW